MKREKIEVEVGGKTLIFETGKIARQAGGSVFLHCGETSILATACAAPEPSEGLDFLPLRVDYQEKFSSVGKTLAGWIKREGRPTQREILVSRLIDRPIRPFIQEGYYHETQLLAYVYSYDKKAKPDVLAICAASAALAISEVPLIKPVAGVRVALIDGKFTLNPSNDEMEKSELDLIMAGTEDAILMIEGFCDFLTEEQVLEALETGHEAIKKICAAIQQWQEKIGKPKLVDKLILIPEELKKEVIQIAKEPLEKAFKVSKKQDRETLMTEIKETVYEALSPELEPRFKKTDVKIAFKKVSSDIMRKMVLTTNKRIDGRELDQIRSIDVENGFLPRTHGSAVFTRGETQAIAVCTLGGDGMGQKFEDLHGEGIDNFYLQYFFPPYSVGEVGRMGPPGRREVGHGKLAERSIKPTLPSKESFPYVMRVESNITECNGSSSMASVCGGCLALMDAGVPIKRPVSGIAMGLILEGKKHVILSDILGAEDALGDMDFKIAGDADGITAFQMDIKVEGITHEIMEAALKQAKEGRIHILEKMLEVMPQSNKDISNFAPRIETMQIPPSKIGIVIGPGGKQIRAIIEETGVEMNIDDSGTVSIASSNPESMNRAKEIVFNLTAEAEIGKIYHGKIVSIVQFGLFVEIFPGKEGLCHISECSHSRIQNLNDHFKEGDRLDVKVLDVDDRGKIKLSHKVLLEKIVQA